ncbi:predicted protein [Chaetomium globosum CBS 148.51]|uniref:Uncharacterized protein n=1 Tax=Chaetomium globosum (strain ATCC 6205 / CBS 148.51 / DSM 1962 / NBRC 6347 / NRRL 1970) TaxID=306901 RepID=Q2GQ83_CHAGB|nr:uncharacterized protein CHGG_09871 [Chaetomium globosum CBS 148.51]EAQ83467.1 predicted protein [Chaetomium globosum CBS 148.51]
MCRIERQNGQPLPSPCPMPAPCHTTSDRREQRRHSLHVIPPRSHQPRAHTRYQQDTGHKIMYALNEASTPPHFNQEKPPIDGREDLQPLTDQEIADESSHRIHHLRSACMQAVCTHKGTIPWSIGAPRLAAVDSAAVLAPLGPRLTTHLLGALATGWSAKNGFRTLLEHKNSWLCFHGPGAQALVWSRSQL